MTVAELISELQKCDPEDIVVYNFFNAFKNDNFDRVCEMRDGSFTEDATDYDCTIDEVYVGGGTNKGFVFLVEKLLEEDFGGKR